MFTQGPLSRTNSQSVSIELGTHIPALSIWFLSKALYLDHDCWKKLVEIHTEVCADRSGGIGKPPHIVFIKLGILDETIS